MRVTRKQAEINRQRIIDSAIRLFGERGVDRVGVAEVMGDAGFTHGGFYNHFTSKDDLVIEACSTSLMRAVSSMRGDERPLRAADTDLGTCLSPAMLSESSRGNTALSAVFAKGIDEFLDVLVEQYGDRNRAVEALSCYVGAQAISRAVEQADRGLAEQFGSAPDNAQPRVHANS